MDISIQKGEGLSQAIKRQLKDEGIQEQQFTGSVWSKIQQALNDGTSVLKHGSKETKIGELWIELQQGVKTYVDDKLKIADNTWKNIKNLFNGVQSPQGTTNAGAVSDATTTDEGNTTTEIKITLKEEKCNYVETHTQQGQAKAAELRKLLMKIPVPMKKVRNAFNNTDKTLIAYIVQAFPEIADAINDQFRLGFGFGKKDVYNFVLKPLIDRANELDINTKGINDKLSLNDMKKYIKQLSSDIIDREEAIDSENAEYNSDLGKIQERVDQATSSLITAANNKSNKITKKEGDGDKGKYCTLPNGTTIFARYDDSGEICSVQIYKDYDEDCSWRVGFGKKGVNVHDITPSRDNWYYNCPTDGYNYNDILALAQKIFGEWED